MAKRIILWVVVVLVVLSGGIALGYGFRGTIASAFSLNAQEAPVSNAAQIAVIIASWNKNSQCPPPKLWTGNGCADPRTWTAKDNKFYDDCMSVAWQNPPPALPDHGVTEAEAASCAQQTQKGSPRK